MINIDDLYIVNYCHPNCVPLRNIMRLPKDEAYALAHEMAEKIKKPRRFIDSPILKTIILFD